MNHKKIVGNFWSIMETNDFHAVAQLLHDGYVLERPQSGECIRGRDNFAAISTAYPAEGKWAFKINHIVTEGEMVVTDSTAREGKIWKQIEFWPAPFKAPEWRAQWIEKSE
jgi:limonene-1,2-epoxide hydrolase